MRAAIVQDADPANRADHFPLVDDSTVRRLTLAALEQRAGTLTYHQDVSLTDTPRHR